MARLTDGVIQLDLENFTFERFVPTEEYKQSKKKKK